MEFLLVYKNEIMIIEFEGKCIDILGNEDVFKEVFKNEIFEKFGIIKVYIWGIYINCGLILVIFIIIVVSGKVNIL